MRVLTPQVLLLLVPLGLLLWRTARVRGPAMWLRVALAVVLVLALSRPEIVFRSAGSDVVVVVDRSRSMPPQSEETASELIRLVTSQRRPGDRVGVISFGREARVELPLSADAAFGGFGSALDGEASNLEAALDATADLIPPERAGRVLVISDGHATGLDARVAARRLAARGVAVDFRWLGREDSAFDVAVTGLEVPSAVSVREPFLLSATVKATSPGQTTLVLLRNGKPLVKTTRELRAGANLISFRDLIEAPGLATYELRATTPGDGVSENDVGRGVVRVEGPPQVLLLTDHPSGTLAQTLTASGIQTTVRAPGPVTMADLEGVGALVLEDVPAEKLGENGLHVVAQFVREAGGGLVMTGGRHSFGEGGYRKSPVEEVLPVSLEIREEQRKAAIALSIIMDCSCSMGATVPDGRTKMELAAEGVVGALQLLNERDEASVYMVDTGPHEIFSMTPVSSGLPLGKVSKGFTGGGGIYVGVGLRTAKSEILKSDKPTRHVLLFSDAADSEAPEDYQRTITELIGQGVTVSVIGMGKATDSDAELLRDVAARGQGRIYFAEDPTSLPRVFSQETIAVARSSYVEGVATLTPGPDLSLLGKVTASETSIDGYNLTYLRPNASVGLRTTDANAAPVVAFSPRGLGRSVAITAEVDGKYTGAFRSWSGQRALLEQAVRWVMPAQATELDGVARAVLRGNDLHVTLDVDSRAPPPAGNATLVLLSGDAHAPPLELPMHWEDEDRLGAHALLPGSGTWHPVVRVGDRVYRAPAVALPWAPEFEPTLAAEGKELLAGVAKVSGGVERKSMTGLFSDALQSEGIVPLAPFLVALAVALLVFEVFTLRFWAGPKVRRVTAPRVSAPRSSASASAPTPSPMAAPPSEKKDDPPPPEPPKPPGVSDALSQARERAKRRTGR